MSQASTNNGDIGFTAQLSREIDGTDTEFVFQRFANRWFLVVTQYGKLPNLYTVKFDVGRDDAAAAEMQGPVDHPQFHMSVPLTMTCNFGADTDEVRSGIQFLVNKSRLNKCPTELVCALGLKETNGKSLRAVAQVLDEIIA